MADPRTDIASLRDDTPILMMPVRLETRFDKTTDPMRPELLVRIYPDDWSVDSFEPQLSAGEVSAAKDYWLAMYAAEGFPEEQRGAWRVLANGYGAGRAEWIAMTYRPIGGPPAPKVDPDDIVLTIGTETPLSGPDTNAITQYWPAVWLADGKKSVVDTAYNALAGAVGGQARADELVANYVPSNIRTKPVRAGVKAAAHVVVFPPAAAVKEHSWTRAATAELMPDAFVFIGYHATGEQVVLGNPVVQPLVVSPDPGAPEPSQLRSGRNGELLFPPEMQWMVDFRVAETMGMALRVPMDPATVDAGFRRVLVLGVRLGDPEMGQRELERLIDHHRFSRAGIAVVPQGTPTNNTDDGSSGYSTAVDPDSKFDELGRPLFVERPDWRDKPDGQWLAEHLGISMGLAQKIENSGASDQLEARAMNAALWPATLGYWMQSMMSPIFPTETAEWTRTFFERYVVGRGAIPAIRIGKQPYGILPATVFSKMDWIRDADLGQHPDFRYLRGLYSVLGGMNNDWATLAGQVSYAGKSGDPYQTLLDILGLHSGSVEYAQRYGESVQQLHNRLALEGLGSFVSALVILALQKGATDLLTKLGYAGPPPPELLHKYFLREHNQLKGPVIGDDARSYIEWLLAAARKSLEALYLQEGFPDDKPPESLLYLMLRQALQLGYHEVAVRLYEAYGILFGDAARRARLDDPFIHIRATPIGYESRYQILHNPSATITGDPNLSLADYITRFIDTIPAAAPLREQFAALERLRRVPPERLERLFSEHVDLCSYRLDSWLLGLVGYQLSIMRNIRDPGQPTKQGIHLGAYAWLEDLKPDPRTLKVASIADPLVEADFQPNVAPMLMTDSTNEGFVHAPSVNHAVAAAVLRNGYLSNATPANPTSMSTTLTSERVRIAMSIIEGIRGGQSIGALLGYQLERGLHDRHSFGVNLDQYIYKLRREFPLASNRLTSTKVNDPNVAQESIEARNVVDGMALANHVRRVGNNYPWGKTLPGAVGPQKAALEAEVQRMIDTWDAVADLALAEGIYEAVTGDFDRVASTLDAFGKGTFAPEPHIVRTPASGMGLTHRVALHLEPGAAGGGATPRALAEPALDRWIAGVLPPLNEIGCMVDYRDSANAAKSREVLLSELALRPVDFVHLFREDADAALAELDERIMTIVTPLARPDSAIAIRYMDKDTADVSLFELTPLLRHLRRLLASARPLRATDMALAKDARRSDDATVVIDRQRIIDTRDALAAARAAIDTFLSNATGADRATILAGIDGWIDDVAALLSRAALFGIPQSGWGFAFDFRARIFGGLVTKFGGMVARWNTKLADFDQALADYDAIGGTPSDAERMELLARADRMISMTPTSPVPATPEDYRTALDTRRAAFVAKRDQLDGVARTTRMKLSELVADAAAALPTDAFDYPPLSIDDDVTQVVAFAEDLMRVLAVVSRDGERRIAAANASIAAHDAAAGAQERIEALTAAAKSLLGEEIVIIAELSLLTAQADELEDASGFVTTLLDYAVTKTPQPVDTWLYGVARVREPLRHWEQLVMLAGAFGRTEPELTPLQFPFDKKDRWLALEFPKDLALDHERLLYTAHFAKPFDRSVRVCGLLLDEWTEVIPAADTTTGLALHYDQPNNEAPNAMLLVTPSAFRGAWQWNDVVGALNETFDLAKRRAVEPVHIDATRYAQFLPATVMAVTLHQLTMSANLAINNNLARQF